MKSAKKSVSIILILVILQSLFLSCNVLASTSDSISDKIEKKLQEVMNCTSSSEKIPVSVWFKDINVEPIKNEIINKFQNKYSRELIEMAFDGKSAINYYREYVFDKTNSKIQSLNLQEIIELKRSKVSENMLKYTNDIISKILPEDSIQKTDIIYSCRYVPNVEMYLTVDNIKKFVYSDDIEYIYYRDKIQQGIPDDTYDTDGELISCSSDYFIATGIDTVRDAFHLKGEGVQIGVYDAEFCGWNNIKDLCYRNNNVMGYDCESGTINNCGPGHGDRVATIIAGKSYHDDYCDYGVDYTGIVPNADMYFAAGDLYKQRLDYLLSSGCSVINISRSFGNDVNNIYGETAKWIDNLIVNNNVSIVISSGNNGSTGVNSGKMSYYSIIVGNCNNNGVLATNSSYINSTNKPFKPDLVAPGQSIVTACKSSVDSGTSFSAPMVTGVVAQLCQVNAALRANPILMKSVIVCSTKRTNYMIANNIVSSVGSNTIALDRMYGSGILSATHAYQIATSSNSYITGSLSPSSNSYTFTTTLSPKNKTLRFVSICDKGYINANIEALKLKITAPNGNIYISQYNYDNKSVVVIPTASYGSYTVEITRLNNNGERINFAIAYSKINEN